MHLDETVPRLNSDRNCCQGHVLWPAEEAEQYLEEPSCQSRGDWTRRRNDPPAPSRS